MGGVRRQSRKFCREKTVTGAGSAPAGRNGGEFSSSGPTPFPGPVNKIFAHYDADAKHGASALYFLKRDAGRELTGVLFFSPHPDCAPLFFVNGTPCLPRYSRFFSYTLPRRGKIFARLFWLPHNGQDALRAALAGEDLSLRRAEGQGNARGLPAALRLLRPRNWRRILGLLAARLLFHLPRICETYAGAWLFVDRDFKADDNAEHLYRWVAREHPEQRVFFALRKDSPDWPRLAAEGFNLIEFRGLAYAFAYMHCSWLFSSSRTDDVTLMPWRRRCSLVRHQFCHLKHGVNKEYQPGVCDPNIDLLVATAPAEYEAFVAGTERPYTLTPREVTLAGMPRHDALLRKAAAVSAPKAILFMPTWRMDIVHRQAGNKPRPYNDRFKHSDFLRNWLAVLRSPRLRSLVARGCRALFFPHPCLRQQLPDFGGMHADIVPDVGGSIQDALAGAALLVTDYSSIAFDFALLRRPVLYFQFDSEHFYASHHGRGYFDYATDGFGTVALNAEELLDNIEEAAAEGFAMPRVFRQRAESFFAHADGGNCRRVYEAVLEASRPARTGEH